MLPTADAVAITLVKSPRSPMPAGPINKAKIFVRTKPIRIEASVAPPMTAVAVRILR
jgi:hypothetical protein